MNTCSTPGCTRGGQLRRGKCRACYEKWRLRQHAYGRFDPLFVDAAPAIAHIEKLREAGVSWRRMSELTGVYRTQIRDIYPDAVKIGKSTAERILNTPIPAGKHTVALDNDRVPAIGAVRRLRALVANGWTQSYLAERLGMTIQNLSWVTHHKQDGISVRRDRDIRALFDELQLTPGPSVRARNLGVKHGWALPLEWDEELIDDPAAEPVLARRTKWDNVQGRAVERREKVRELTDKGLSVRQIADQLKVTTRQITRDRSAA